MFIALLVAAQLAVVVPSQPTPTNFRSWFSGDDYPLEAAKKGIEGDVTFEVDVDAAGKPTACRIAKSSGSDLLDQKTCQIVLARAQFLPARSNGKAVPSRFSKTTSWRLEGTASVPTDGYFAVILDYTSDAEPPKCSIVQKGVIGVPSCEQVIAQLGSLGAGRRLTKLVTLMSVTRGAEKPYEGEADWGRRLSFLAVDLYLSEDGKRACTVVASEGQDAHMDPCAPFAAKALLSDDEKRAASKQHLEKSLFAISSNTPSQGKCKSGESEAESQGCL